MPNKQKINWWRRGSIFMEIFLGVWIIACLAAWFLINSADIVTYDLAVMNNLPRQTITAIQKKEQWFKFNPWIRQYIWRTFR